MVGQSVCYVSCFLLLDFILYVSLVIFVSNYAGARLPPAALWSVGDYASWFQVLYDA